MPVCARAFRVTLRVLPCRPGLGGGARGPSCASPGLWRERAALSFPCSPPRAATGRRRAAVGTCVGLGPALSSPSARVVAPGERSLGVAVLLRAWRSGWLDGREMARGPSGVCGCWRCRVEGPWRRGSWVCVGEDVEGRQRRAPVSQASRDRPGVWRWDPVSVSPAGPAFVAQGAPCVLSLVPPVPRPPWPWCGPHPPSLSLRAGPFALPPPGEGGLFEGSAARVPVGALWGWGLSVTGGGGGAGGLPRVKMRVWVAVAEARRPPVGRVRCCLPIPAGPPLPSEGAGGEIPRVVVGVVCSGATGRPAGCVVRPFRPHRRRVGGPGPSPSPFARAFLRLPGGPGPRLLCSLSHPLPDPGRRDPAVFRLPLGRPTVSWGLGVPAPLTCVEPPRTAVVSRVGLLACVGEGGGGGGVVTPPAPPPGGVGGSAAVVVLARVPRVPRVCCGWFLRAVASWTWCGGRRRVCAGAGRSGRGVGGTL